MCQNIANRCDFLPTCAMPTHFERQFHRWLTLFLYVALNICLTVNGVGQLNRLAGAGASVFLYDKVHRLLSNRFLQCPSIFELGYKISAFQWKENLINKGNVFQRIKAYWLALEQQQCFCLIKLIDILVYFFYRNSGLDDAIRPSVPQYQSRALYLFCK